MVLGSLSVHGSYGNKKLPTKHLRTNLVPCTNTMNILEGRWASMFVGRLQYIEYPWISRKYIYIHIVLYTYTLHICRYLDTPKCPHWTCHFIFRLNVWFKHPCFSQFVFDMGHWSSSCAISSIVESAMGDAAPPSANSPRICVSNGCQVSSIFGCLVDRLWHKPVL